MYLRSLSGEISGFFGRNERTSDFFSSLLAQEAVDTAKMTSKEYMTLDAAAMMAATTAVKADPMAGAEMKDVSDNDAIMKIMKDCEGVPDMTLMDAMHMKM